MWDWITQNSGALSAVLNAAMLVVWIAYLQLFFVSFRRSNRTVIHIGMAGERNGDARCLVTNMGSDTAYVLAVKIDLDFGEETRSALVTDRIEDDDPLGGDFREKTNQGPLGGGEVLDITRSGESSLLPAGENVLTDDQLRELGAVLWHIDRNLPVDTGEHERGEIVLDLEFKIESDGRLAIKQVRPFLRNAPMPPRPQFELNIADSTPICVGFGNSSIQRDPRNVYELKSHVKFRGGAHALRTDSLITPLELIEEVRFGPGARLLQR